MTRLTLMRHANSSWNKDEDDFDRPLSERGQSEASLMGRVCSESLPLPDLILVSSARRTVETVDLFSRAWGWEDLKRIDTDSLYLAGLADWVNLIGVSKDRADHIFACAHQPGVELFARWLDPGFSGGVPTGTVISITLGEGFGSGMGKVDFYGTPPY